MWLGLQPKDCPASLGQVSQSPERLLLSAVCVNSGDSDPGLTVLGSVPLLLSLLPHFGSQPKATSQHPTLKPSLEQHPVPSLGRF